MRLISLVSVAFFLLITLSSGAQVVTKVKRKGVQSHNVTKPAPNGNKYSMDQFNGKWQEISRNDRASNSNVDFEDTLFFIFSGDNNVYTRNGINFSLNGKAALRPGNILNTGSDEFIIKSLDETKAVLDDGDTYIHTMIKKQSFLYESLPTDSIVLEKFTTPVDVSYANIIGKWSVYRRDAKPGSISTDEPILRMINIENNNDTANSEITFYVKEKSETVPCHITLEGTKIHLVTLKHSWSMDVYKADDKEFVFGSAELMYYCKRM